MAKAGATELVRSSDVDRALKTLEGIIPTEQISFIDLSDLPTVARYDADLSDAYLVIDLTIFNAGIMACPLGRTQQGLEWQ